MKFLIALSLFFSITALAQEPNLCDKITKLTLENWQRWAEAPENKKTATFTSNYSDADKTARGIVLFAPKNNIEPLKIELTANGNKIASLTADDIRTDVDHGTNKMQILLPNIVARDIKQKMREYGDGIFNVTYTSTKQSTLVKDLKLEGIIKNIHSANGRSAQVVSMGGQNTAVIVPEPNEKEYKAIVLKKNCQIEKIVYAVDGKKIPGATRNDCNMINHQTASGHSATIDQRMQLDCKDFFNWLPMGQLMPAEKAPAAKVGS